MATSELPGSRTIVLNEQACRRFADHNVVVTGGASGIGRATVERLVEEGATVAIFDVNESLGSKLQAELTSKGKTAVYYKVDVSDKDQCRVAVKDFASRHQGVINGLVNCAVYFGSKGLTAEKGDWDKSLNVNIVGYSNMVQSCHPFMKLEHHSEAPISTSRSIVNIASISGHQAQPKRWTYSATKGAVLTMTKCMALDLSGSGIRVNSVSPAWVWSPEVSKAAGGDRDKWEPIWGNFHMPRRMAETKEIAAVVAFLLSKDSLYVTATDIPVDGGYTAMGPEGLGEKSFFAGEDY